MECLSEESLDEFSEDALVWVIINRADPDRYLLFPKNEEVLAAWAFMKREDADHLVLMLKKAAPAYKNIELIVDTMVETESCGNRTVSPEVIVSRMIFDGSQV